MAESETQSMIESRVVDRFPLNDQEILCRHLHKVAADRVADYQRELAAGVWWLGQCYEIPFMGKLVHNNNAVFLVAGTEYSALVETGIPWDTELLLRQVDEVIGTHGLLSGTATMDFGGRKAAGTAHVYDLDVRKELIDVARQWVSQVACRAHCGLAGVPRTRRRGSRPSRAP
jgi:hypothetical protein